MNRLSLFQPSQTINFTFQYRSNFYFSEHKENAEFEISFIEKRVHEASGNVFSIKETYGRKVFRKSLVFKSSKSSSPLGAVIGGVMGYLVKEIFVASPNETPSFSTSSLLGAVILSLTLAIITRRTDEGKVFFLTIEDFYGGAFVGILCGLYNETILDFIESFLP